MKQKPNNDAFRQRLQSSNWDQSIMSAVNTTRKQRQKTRTRLIAAFSLLLIASFSIGAFVVTEENANTQVYTMLEQLASHSLTDPFLE